MKKVLLLLALSMISIVSCTSRLRVPTRPDNEVTVVQIQISPTHLTQNIEGLAVERNGDETFIRLPGEYHVGDTVHMRWNIYINANKANREIISNTLGPIKDFINWKGFPSDDGFFSFTKDYIGTVVSVKTIPVAENLASNN